MTIILLNKKENVFVRYKYSNDILLNQELQSTYNLKKNQWQTQCDDNNHNLGKYPRFSYYLMILSDIWQSTKRQFCKPGLVWAYVIKLKIHFFDSNSNLFGWTFLRLYLYKSCKKNISGTVGCIFRMQCQGASKGITILLLR